MDNLSRMAELTKFQLANLEQAAQASGLVAVYEEAHTDEEKAIIRGHLSAMEDLAARGLLTEVTESLGVMVKKVKQETGFGYRAWSLSDDAMALFRPINKKVIN